MPSPPCSFSIPRVGVIITATFGLCLWIVLWAIGFASGFDSILIVIALVMIAIDQAGARQLADHKARVCRGHLQSLRQL